MLIDVAIRMRDSALLARTVCPKCGDSQVQLVDWSSNPTKWRCRACKCRFEVEVANFPNGGTG